MPLVLYICRTKIEQNTQILAKEPLERRPRVTCTNINQVKSLRFPLCFDRKRILIG
jgi:hypothetical protein